jgi:hypothetical protein
MPKITLLLGLTTTWGSDWRAKVKEIDQFRIEEIALFVTGIERKERDELYRLLENSQLKKIRHTHLREQDMKGDEIDYLRKRWGCELFNLPPTNAALESLKTDLRSYRDLIYIENTGRSMNTVNENFERVVMEGAGLCIDFSHWQDYGILQKLPGYDNFETLANEYPIGCAHISAIMDNPNTPIKGIDTPNDYNRHTYTRLDQFDYLPNFKKYFPPYLSLELENSFEEQIKAKEYINKLINGES